MASYDLWKHEPRRPYVWVPKHVTMLIIGCPRGCQCGSGYEYLKIQRTCVMDPCFELNLRGIQSRTLVVDTCPYTSKRMYFSLDWILRATILRTNHVERIILAWPVSSPLVGSELLKPETPVETIISSKEFRTTYKAKKSLVKFVMDIESMSPAETKKHATRIGANVVSTGRNKTICQICFLANEIVFWMPCKHTSCADCFEKWQDEGKQTCFFCRGSTTGFAYV